MGTLLEDYSKFLVNGTNNHARHVIIPWHLVSYAGTSVSLSDATTDDARVARLPTPLS